MLGTGEGGHLIHFRDQGNIFIKVGAATGSDNLALGTQQVMAGSGIPIHRPFPQGRSFPCDGGQWNSHVERRASSFRKGALSENL